MRVKKVLRSMKFSELALYLVIGIILLGPVIVGVLPVYLGAAVLSLLVLFAVYAFSPLNQLRLLRQITLIALSTCLSLTVLDLAARPLLFHLTEERPAELFNHHWPPLPQVFRYTPGLTFRGQSYGDLAAMSRRREWREMKQTLFVTDEYGFRNELPKGQKMTAPDLIVLGDSFGVSALTSQEATLGSILAERTGLKVYNLSMEAASPWQEYMNLLLAGDWLPAGKRTVVLWMIFPGNDLDEEYHPFFVKSQLPWRGRLGQLVDAYRRFRSRSPLRRLTGVAGPTTTHSVVEERFIDGRRLLFYSQYIRNKDLTAEQIRQHPNFEMLKATFGAMRTLADERHLTVFVALVPSKEEVYSWVLDHAPPWTGSGAASPFSEALRDVCQQHGMALLDLKPVLADASKRVFDETGELLWWGDDTHWNDVGQRVAAAAIYDRLLRQAIEGQAGKQVAGERIVP